MENKKLIEQLGCFCKYLLIALFIIVILLLGCFILNVFFLNKEHTAVLIYSRVCVNICSGVYWNVFILLGVLLLLLFSGLCILKFLYGMEYNEFQKNQEFERKLKWEKDIHALYVEEQKRQAEESQLLKLKDFELKLKDKELVADKQNQLFYLLALGLKSGKDELDMMDLKSRIEEIKKGFEVFNKLMEEIENIK